MHHFVYSPFTIPIVAIVGVFLWLSISALAKVVYGIVRHRNEIELKQAMVARGLKADEIERILLATALHDEQVA